MDKKIGIVLGSASDIKRIQKGMDRLKALGVPFEMIVASAHRTPEPLVNWLSSAEKRGIQVIIAGAGASAHLPGVVASKTLLPVIGIPLSGSPLGGTDALYSIVQMPPGIPVATVGIDSAENAVILALHILALQDPAIHRILVEYRGGWQKKIAAQNVEFYQEHPELQPENPGGMADTQPGPSKTTQADRFQGPAGNIHRINSEEPDLSQLEEVVDCLLEGGIVALPTDTVYGLAVDATNPEAVERLRNLKKREPEKPIAILLDSMNMFRMLAEEPDTETTRLLEKYWPGPFTLVAKKRQAVLESLSRDGTLGFRVPNHYYCLGLINLLSRPLATTSANLAGQKECVSAQEIAETFGGQIDYILDGGPLEGGLTSTVLSVVESPFRLLREGPVRRPDIEYTIGSPIG